MRVREGRREGEKNKGGRRDCGERGGGKRRGEGDRGRKRV